MQDILVGLLAIAAGAILCFNGYITLRFAIPIWGFFVGFATGAGAISAITNDAVLAKPLGWMVGFALAVGFSLLAYLYYEVSIVLATGSIGFVIGSSILVALNVPWNWLIVLFAIVLGILAGVFAIKTNMPRVVLVVLSALGGAAAIVTGVMLVTGQLDLADLSTRYAVDRIEDGFGWYIAELVLAVAGLTTQMGRVRETDLRDDWRH